MYVDLNLPIKKSTKLKEFLKINSTFKTYENTEELINNERLNTWKDKTILLKGSRGIRLETLIGEM